MMAANIILNITDVYVNVHLQMSHRYFWYNQNSACESFLKQMHIDILLLQTLSKQMLHSLKLLLVNSNENSGGKTAR